MLAATLAIAGPAQAQTTEAATCTVAGRPCFGVDQLRQLATVPDDVMARRVAADPLLVAATIRQFVAYWVDYSVALGYTFAFSYLPG